MTSDTKPGNITAAEVLEFVLNGIKTPQMVSDSNAFLSTLAHLQEWNLVLTELITTLDTNRTKQMESLGKLGGQPPNNNEPTKG